MKKWEYTVADFTPSAFLKERGVPMLQNDLAKLGEEGWDLIYVYHGRFFVFKRPLENRTWEE